MINVNWDKIKPYEKKPVAVSVIAALSFLGIVFFVFCFIKATLPPVRILCSLLITFLFGFYIHIESRMVQIYAIMGVLDLLLFFSAFLLFPKTLTIVIFVVLIIAVIGTLVFAEIAEKRITEKTRYKGAEPNRAILYGGKNVMMFAPHEDDEINLYSGIIEQYVQYGSTVRIVFLTNGDYYGLGNTRLNEAINVAKEYRIPQENIIFLGYSDSLKNDNKHIYNCNDDELVKSSKGYVIAYGLDNHNSFSNNEFKRVNIINDIKEIIELYKPDTLFCCDYDSHCDHRALSLFFEEALGDILKQDNSYHPDVFKGFAYSTAWEGNQDFYSLNSKSTHLDTDSNLMQENNVYLWDDRVRFPVAKRSLSRTLQNSSSYKAMMKYSSQTATDHAGSILNGDKVFWKRRTDSVLYQSKITATGGNPNGLIDFKLVDSDDICDKKLIPEANAWIADKSDNKRIVMIMLDEPKSISCIKLYESPIVDNNIINATVQIGSKQFKTGAFDKNKRSATFCFDSIVADKLAVRIDEFEGECSLLKIEAFESFDEELKLVKLVNSNDDFCYDYYILEGGEESFGIYKYPQDAQCNVSIEVFGDIEAEYKDGKIKVKCLTGHKGNIKIKTQNDDVYDEVRISNPDARERKEILSKQRLEQKIMTLPMQRDYYSGLIKRLGIYIKR